MYGAGIVALDGGIEDAGKKMKNSFNWMIRTIMDNRGEIRRESITISPPQSRKASTTQPYRSSRLEPSSVSNSPEMSRRGSGGVTFENPFGNSDVNTPILESSSTPKRNTSVTSDSAKTIDHADDSMEQEKLSFPVKSS